MGVLSCYLDGQPIDVVPNIPRLFLSVVSSPANGLLIRFGVLPRRHLRTGGVEGL